MAGWVTYNDHFNRAAQSESEAEETETSSNESAAETNISADSG